MIRNPEHVRRRVRDTLQEAKALVDLLGRQNVPHGMSAEAAQAMLIAIERQLLQVQIAHKQAQIACGAGQRRTPRRSGPGEVVPLHPATDDTGDPGGDAP